MACTTFDRIAFLTEVDSLDPSLASVAVRDPFLMKPKPKAKTRTERWREACRSAREAIEELIKLQSQYESWRDNLPEGLDEGPTAELLDKVIDLELKYSDRDYRES
jgi:hypothetical protein